MRRQLWSVSKKNQNLNKFLIAVALTALLVLSVILLPAVGNSFKTNWFPGLYLKYSKWRYDWRSASDMGDGQGVLQIILEGPMGIAEDGLGNIYISDQQAGLIWKVEPSGRAIVIAGTGKPTGSRGLPTAPWPARDVDIGLPEGLVVDQDGNLLLADSYNHAILKIDPNGQLTRFAGNGQRGFNGDHIKATEASLAFPADVRLDLNGNVYIADVRNHRVRKVARDGVITTVAGTGVPGYSGDGGSAVNARLRMPSGILLDKNNNLFIADSYNDVIREVGPNGIIRTIAGSGHEGFEGDGGPALAAKFNTPQSLAIDVQGRIYIGDEHNNAIRVLELDGTVRTLIGKEGPGFSGDGGPASDAQIANPENLWVRKDNALLITARDNSRVRIVYPEGTIGTYAGRGPTSKHHYYAPIRLQPIDP